MAKKQYAAFTLVELLVVIGIISLLVSILLPALGKARQQANSVACSSNLRSIGQLLNIYASENKGFLPYGHGGVPAANYGQNMLQSWGWPDSLQLLNQPANYATVQVPGNGWWPPLPQSNQAAALSGIFRDADIPDMGFDPHCCAYNGNPRLLPDATYPDPLSPTDPTTGNNQLYHNRSLGSINSPSQVMLVWDGALSADSQTGLLYSSSVVDYTIDDSTISANGYGTCCGLNTPWYSAQQYSTPVAEGNGFNGAGSNWANSVTKSVLIGENVDQLGTGWNSNGLRYRHNNNTSCNTLFADGHVERKGLGEVRSIDICVNY